MFIDNHVYIGKNNVWGHEHAFGLSTQARRQHLYVGGQTGVGKTTLLLNTAVQDIMRGDGVGYIDPHGDAAEWLLDAIPP